MVSSAPPPARPHRPKPVGTGPIRQERAAALQPAAVHAQGKAPLAETTHEFRGLSRWFALAAFAVVLWAAREVLTPFIVGAVLAYILSPLADQISERVGLRRRWTGIAVFAVFLFVVVVGISALASRLTIEARELGSDVPSVIEHVADQLTGGQNLDLFGRSFTPRELAVRVNESLADRFGSPGDALHAVQVALSSTLSTLVALLTLAYLLVDSHYVGGFLLRFVPHEHQDNVEVVAAQIHRVLGRYLQGQMLLIVLVSTVTYLVLSLVFQLPYALPIAVATGFLEIIPLIGPIFAAGIACAVALTQGGVGQAGFVALAYLIIRQVEDQLVMPLVVGRAVHVHPLATIFAVVAGEHLGGVLGALLAVPLAAAAKVILDYAYPPPRTRIHA